MTKGSFRLSPHPSQSRFTVDEQADMMSDADAYAHEQRSKIREGYIVHGNRSMYGGGQAETVTIFTGKTKPTTFIEGLREFEAPADQFVRADIFERWTNPNVKVVSFQFEQYGNGGSGDLMPVEQQRFLPQLIAEVKRSHPNEKLVFDSKFTDQDGNVI